VARDAEDHIEVHIGKPCSTCCAICRFGIHSAVPAAQGFEVSIVEGLHAETQTVASTCAKSAKLLSVSRRGVRFKGNFGFRGNPKGCRGSVEYALYLGWCEHTGRAATKEYCLQRTLVGQRLPGTYLGTDRLDVAVIQGPVPGQNGEGAIWAALWTERDMHIEAERLR
jgi:hypothetical protein